MRPGAVQLDRGIGFKVDSHLLTQTEKTDDESRVRAYSDAYALNTRSTGWSITQIDERIVGS